MVLKRFLRCLKARQKTRIFSQAPASKRSAVSSAILRRWFPKTICLTQSTPTRLNMHSSKRILRSTAPNALSTNASRSSTLGPTILTRSTSSTLWTTTLQRRFALTYVPKTHRRSGFLSSSASSQSPQMTSSALFVRSARSTRTKNFSLLAFLRSSRLPSKPTTSSA